jgi:hypothetical protein
MRLCYPILFLSAFASVCDAQVATVPTAADLPVNERPSVGPSPTRKDHGTQGHAKAATAILGNAANVYTILVSAQNQVCYDPAINTVVFTHRHNPADFNNEGGTGTLRFDVSTDGGTTWTTDHLLSPNIFDGSADTIIGCRYPNGTIYNPPGNTDPANAAVVSTGMTLNSVDTTLGLLNTGYLQRSSARLDGSAATCTFTDFYGDRTTYSAYGLCAKGDGTLWALSARTSNDSNNTDTVSFKDFRVNKGIWNDGTQQVDWTDVATLSPQMVVYGDYTGGNVKNTQVNSWNMAFSPDGQTGYAVIIGKEYDGIPSGPMPLVWKSIDGGTTWDQLPNHDFSQEQWVLDNIMGANDTGEPRPYFSSDHDIIVDANGTLHLVCSVLSQYLGNSADSVGFIFSDIATQFILHTSTSDGITWTVAKLSDKAADDYEYPVNLVAPPGPTQGDRLQASRTADGSHVFFTWNSSFNGVAVNQFPEIHGIGYNALTDLWTEARSISAGTDADATAWWHTVSPVCISDGDDFDFELPTVFANPGDYADVPSGFTYIKGIGFNESEFVVGVEEIGSIGSVSVFPNPSEGRFTISLVNTGAADLRVADLSGRIVRTLHTKGAQLQLDLGDQPLGCYTLLVSGEKGRYARKLMVR